MSTRAVRSGGVTSHVLVHGDGPPVLVLHGAEADHRMFGALIGELAPYVTVVANDQRDCGHTVHDGAPYGLVELADDAIDVLDALGVDRAVVVGQSLGGLLAQLIAVRHPERVERLVLTSTFRVGASLAEINPDGVRAMMVLRAEGAASAQRLAAHFSTDAFIAEHPEFLDTWADIQPITAPEQRAQRQQAMLGGIDPVDLGHITAPTLVVAGEDDRIVPIDHARSLAAEIPGATFVALPGVGHVSPMQVPDVVARHILEFMGVRRRPPLVRRIDHVSFSVSNLDAALDFYIGLLGCELIPRPDLGFPGAWLRLGGGVDVHLLTSIAGVDTGRAPSEPLAFANHVAFVIDNHDETLGHLRALGIDVREGAFGIRQMFVQDPSGNVIEFIQRV